MLRLTVIALVCLMPSVLGKKLSVGNCNNNVDTIIRTIFRKAKEVAVTLNSDDLITLATARTGKSDQYTRKVYFSAYLKAHVRNMRAGQTLVFDDVVVNRGKGYNPINGQFVCPVSGDYWFFLDFLSLEGVNVFLQINIDGKRFTYAYAIPGGKHVSVSRNVLLPLRKGSVVTVSNHLNGGEYYGENRFTGFSGYLLSEN